MIDSVEDIKERLAVYEGDIAEIKSILRKMSEQNKDFKERLVHIEDKENEFFGISDRLSRELVLDSSKRDVRVHYIRSVDWHNAGDMACNPYDYFSELKRYHSIIHDWKEIDWNLISKNDVIILGGGGLFNCTDDLQRTIIKLLDICENVISWGCGFNTHYDRSIKDEIQFEKFKVCSVRDYKFKGFEYVPDVSCMMKELSETYVKKRNVGVIEHLAFPINGFEGYEKISNRFALDVVIGFIGESENIITNSWHCAYWSKLMGKKVVLYRPFSDKFERFENGIIVYSGNLENDLTRATVDDDMLIKCRRINCDFMRRVVRFIETVRDANGG